MRRLQALLQTGRLHLPRTAEADARARELQDYEIKVDTHDDLVTALGLAVQQQPTRPCPRSSLAPSGRR